MLSIRASVRLGPVHGPVGRHFVLDGKAIGTAPGGTASGKGAGNHGVVLPLLVRFHQAVLAPVSARGAVGETGPPFRLFSFHNKLGRLVFRR